MNALSRGGLDLLFSKQPLHKLNLPKFLPPLASSSSSDEPTSTTPSASDSIRKPDMRFLVDYLAKNVLQEREELFRDGETVRPGILVLINDTDWELEQELDYVLEDGDEIVFISTLHGG
ncbi:hypothetical protein BDY24DRAFT_339051 [Mrakia frigida]|uniref:ubiquitin-related modifier URM1 n=1 Tax=Mrakia frigida TaxID=29902 RepID=UPI003FCBF3A6